MSEWWFLEKEKCLRHHHCLEVLLSVILFFQIDQKLNLKDAKSLQNMIFQRDGNLDKATEEMKVCCIMDIFVGILNIKGIIFSILYLYCDNDSYPMLQVPIDQLKTFFLWVSKRIDMFNTPLIFFYSCLIVRLFRLTNKLKYCQL